MVRLFFSVAFLIHFVSRFTVRAIFSSRVLTTEPSKCSVWHPSRTNRCTMNVCAHLKGTRVQFMVWLSRPTAFRFCPCRRTARASSGTLRLDHTPHLITTTSCMRCDSHILFDASHLIFNLLSLFLQCAFSPDASAFLTGGYGERRVWDASKKGVVFPEESGKSPIRCNACAFASDGSVILTSSNNTIRLTTNVHHARTLCRFVSWHHQVRAASCVQQPKIGH